MAEKKPLSFQNVEFVQYRVIFEHNLESFLSAFDQAKLLNV